MFPSILNTFPRPSTTSRLDNPSHSNLHNTVSSALGQVEAFIGQAGDNSVAGTLLYDVRSPDSNGGGHVQTAAKGGTGQTTFTKGDFFVAINSSTISKLTVSSTVGEVMTSDPTTATGVKWSNVVANKVAITTGTASIYNTNAEQVLFATSVLGSTLGTNNGIKFKGIMYPLWWAGDFFTITARYGNNSIVTARMTAPQNAVASVTSYVEGMIVGNSSVALQKGYMNVYASTNKAVSAGDTNVLNNIILGIGFGTSSVNSSANQNLVITGKFDTASNANSVLSQFFVVEKIV